MKKIFKITFLVFFALYLTSCEKGCVESEQFNTEFATVESYPVADGVYGTYDSYGGVSSYDSSAGGQVAQWHSAGFRSNGDPMVIKVTGGWTAWYGNDMSAAKIKQLPLCRICAKSKSKLSKNCICDPGASPTAETMTLSGIPSKATCSTFDEQNNPNLCTCTKDPAQGYSSDLSSNRRQIYDDVYYIALDVVDKDGNPLIADKQNPCRFEKGMGLYIGLFGATGFETPKRVYQLYSLERGCEISSNSSSACIDDKGNDRSFYIYRSPNGRTFLKDDHNGNSGYDNDTTNDEYHKPKEQVKLIIVDRYYADNYGSYNVEFLGGVGSADKKGLIEFIVNLFEDTVLGKVDDNGLRDGGIIKSMYNSIVHDSGFSRMIQLMLILYIAFYGAATLLGIAELNRKELLSRLIKVALVIMFTDKNGWNTYNDFVVRFFKDGMDYVVSIMMSLSDSAVDPSSMIIIAQEDRAASYSNATRFSYVDLLIAKMLSTAVAKKVFGLFFGTYFGFLYIPIIYLIIAFFIYVMIFVAMVYLTNLLKIIFALSLGPIFICFTLFSHTNQMFKNWLAFVGARSLEIILVFMVLYNFLYMIDQRFNSLLSFRTCAEGIDLGVWPLRVLVSHVTNHSPMYWFSALLVLTGFIFITKLLVEKIADLAGHLISIGGVDNKDGSSDVGHGVSGFGMASAMAGEIKDAVQEGAMKAGGFAGKHSINLTTAALRKSGLAESWNNVSKKIPFRGARSRWRDSVVDSAMKSARASGVAKGLSGKALDQHIRNETNNALGKYMKENPKLTAAKGLNMSAANERMDKILFEEPLKKFLKEEGKKMRSSENGADTKMGKDFRQALRAKAREWADKNTNLGAAGLDKFFGAGKDLKPSAERSKFDKKGDRGVRDLIRGLSEVSSEDAAKRFSGSKAKQEEYQKYLDEKDYRENKLKERASSTRFGKAMHGLKNMAKAVTRSDKFDTDRARKNFERNLQYEKGRGAGLVNKMGINTNKGINPFSRIKILDKAAERGVFDPVTRGLRNIFGMKPGKDSANSYNKGALDRQRENLAERLKNNKENLSEGKGLYNKPAADDSGKMSQERVTNKREFFGKQLEEASKKKAQEKMSEVDKRYANLRKELEADFYSEVKGKNKTATQVSDAMTIAGKEAKRIEAERKKEKREEIIKLANNKDLTLLERRAVLEELKSVGVDTSAILTTIDKEKSEKLEAKIKEFEKEVADGKVLTAKEKEERMEELRAIQQGAFVSDFDIKIGLSSREEKAKELNEKRRQEEEKLRFDLEEAGKTSGAANKALEEARKNGDQTAITDAELKFNKAKAEESKAVEAVGLIATSFEVKFGASVQDVLLKPGDVLLKGGSVLLGGYGQDVQGDYVKKAQAESKKYEAEGKEKVMKFAKKMKEAEMNDVKHDPSLTDDQKKSRLASLEKEVGDLTKDLNRVERDIQDIDKEISSIPKSTV